MDKQFFRLGELQVVGLPAERTLRNNLIPATGVINLGGDVPPLKTLLLGGTRVVIKAEIDRWLREVESISSGVSPQANSEEPRRRRGRPRKTAGVQA